MLPLDVSGTGLDRDAEMVKKAARILRPGGRIVIVDLLSHDKEEFQRQMGQASRGFAPEALARMLQGAGLSGGAVRSLTPDPRAKGPALVLATAARAGRTVDRSSHRKKGKKRT